MRKSRESQRVMLNQSWVHHPREFNDRSYVKQNILMPEQHSNIYDDKDNGRVSSCISRYERMLSDKQKDCLKVLTDNQNLMAEVRSLQTRIATLQSNYGKMESVAQSAHGTICQLREECRRLREELSRARQHCEMQIHNREKQFKFQYEKLQHQTSCQLQKVLGKLKQKEKQFDMSSNSKGGSAKLQELQKLVEYHKKQSKLIGMELFNTKKTIESLTQTNDHLKTQNSLNVDKIQILSKTISQQQKQLKDKESLVQERSRQLQHEKNLLYDSMSKTIRNHEEQLRQLKHHLNQPNSLVKCQSQKFLLGSLTSRFHESDQKKNCDQQKQEISRLLALLNKETADKERLSQERKTLMNALLDRQKKEEELKKNQQSLRQEYCRPLYQSIKEKSEQLDIAKMEIMKMGNHIEQMQTMVKSINRKSGTMEELLTETNDQLIKMRLRHLSGNICKYY